MLFPSTLSHESAASTDRVVNSKVTEYPVALAVAVGNGDIITVDVVPKSSAPGLTDSTGSVGYNTVILLTVTPSDAVVSTYTGVDNSTDKSAAVVG